MLLKLYEKNNNPADLQQVIDLLNDGGILIYPTDTMYAIGWSAPSSASAASRISTPRRTIFPSSATT